MKIMISNKRDFSEIYEEERREMNLKDMLEKIDIQRHNIYDVDWTHGGDWMILCSHTKGLASHGDTIERDFRENTILVNNFDQLQRYVELLKEERFGFNSIDILTMMNNDGDDKVVGASVIAQWCWIGRWITGEEFEEMSYEDYLVMNHIWEREWI